jgi:hypothetical protein
MTKIVCIFTLVSVNTSWVVPYSEYKWVHVSSYFGDTEQNIFCVRAVFLHPLLRFHRKTMNVCIYISLMLLQLVPVPWYLVSCFRVAHLGHFDIPLNVSISTLCTYTKHCFRTQPSCFRRLFPFLYLLPELLYQNYGILPYRRAPTQL